MKNLSESRIRFLLGIIGYVALVGYFAALPDFAEAESKGYDKNLFPPQTEVVAGKSTLPDPLTPYDSLIDHKLAEASPIKETAGCSNLEVWQSVAIRTEQWNSITGTVPTGISEVGVLAIHDKTNCVKPGHPFRVVEIFESSGIGVELGWFFPTAIHGRRTDNREITRLENQLLIGAKLSPDSKDVVFVSGRVISSGQRFWGPRMNGVRFINRQQVETAIKDGTAIVDIRPRNSFEKFRIKNSINVPYSTGPRMNFHEDYKNYPNSGDAFDIRKIPADKEKPIVLVGYFDTPNVFRAAVVLRAEGWKNVFIFWEGIEYFTGMSWSPPAVSRLVRIVSGHEVAQMLSDKALNPVIIDVRQGVHFAQGHIPGAYLSEFIERPDLRLRTPGLSGKMLREYGEYIVIPENISPATPVIFVGVSERHWAGYKAALIARDYGLSNVMWYRAGMAEWSRLALANKVIFQVKRIPFPIPKDFKGGVRQ